MKQPTTAAAAWLPLLMPASPRLIAVTGSGGKTSLVYLLARLLKQHGCRVVVSLTTKMYQPDDPAIRVVFADSVNSLVQATADGEALTLVARSIDPTNQRKLIGLPPEWFDEACTLCDSYFIVEADGAAGKSLKGYLPHEPVIPSKTAVVIPVVGLDVLGKPLAETYVHRAEVAAAIAGQVINSPVTNTVLLELLLSESGYRHNIPAAAKTVYYLNKAESPAALAAAHNIAAVLSERYGVVFGSIKTNYYYLMQIYGGGK